MALTDGRGNGGTRAAAADLVREVDCRYCRRPVYLALCRNGRRRTFEKRQRPAAPSGVWAWRRGWGIEETDRAPGYVPHYCAERSRAFADLPPHIAAGITRATP